MKRLTKILNESASYVQSVTGDKNILTKSGFKNIIADTQLTKEYINKLTEGFSADHRETLGALMEQTVKQAILQESYDTLSPFQALSLPLLRVLWPYNSIKDGIQTIVATAPTFLITSKHYYLVKTINGKKVRYELPQNSAIIAENPNGELATAIATGGIAINTSATGESTPFSFNAFSQEFKVGTDAVSNLTTDVKLVELEIAGFPVAIPKHGWNTGKNIVVKIDQYLGKAAEVLTLGDAKDADLYVVGNLILLPNLEDGTVDVMFSGVLRVDELEDGATLADVATAIDGLATGFKAKINASVTEKWNENQWSFEYQTENFSITIPDGKRVSSPLPVELVQDIKALYNLDAAGEFGNGMRALFADSFDIEGIRFFKQTIDAAYPGRLDSALSGTADTLSDDTSIPIKTFNTMPQVGYMGDLVQWRSNTLKDAIRQVTTILEKEWYIKFGKVTLFAHPVAADLLHGVDWTFEPGLAEDGDVTADYSLGTFRAANRAYKLISSHRVEERVMWVLLTPSENDVMTLRY